MGINPLTEEQHAAMRQEFAEVAHKYGIAAENIDITITIRYAVDGMNIEERQESSGRPDKPE